MRKIIFSLIVSIFLILPAFCVEYMPKYTDNIKNFGIGIYFGDGDLVVHQEPNENSSVLANIFWDTEKVVVNKQVYEPKRVFAVFSPKNALSGFIATDEQGEEYTKIIYDTVNNKEGWIKNSPDNKAFYWRQLFYKYGKTRGLYMFANTSNEDKILKVAPEDTAPTSYEFIHPKYIRLQLIKGNWALIKVVDYDNEQKVGWFRWRTIDGKLKLFPAFTE